MINVIELLACNLMLPPLSPEKCYHYLYRFRYYQGARAVVYYLLYM